MGTSGLVIFKSSFFFYRWKEKTMFDVDHPVRSGLTLLEFWQSVLPEEASGHHQRQHEEEHQAQLRPFHLHPATFGESLELDGRSRRSSHSRSLLDNKTKNTWGQYWVCTMASQLLACAGSDHFFSAMLRSAVKGGINPCQLVSLLE